jgi:hypothetical protein
MEASHCQKDVAQRSRILTMRCRARADERSERAKIGASAKILALSVQQNHTDL